jgi:hypothetical protein
MSKSPRRRPGAFVSRDELEEARKQLEEPELAISVVSHEAYEEKSDEPLGIIGKLVYATNNRILIRVHLKFVNQHRVATNVQSLGLSIHANVEGSR